MKSKAKYLVFRTTTPANKIYSSVSLKSSTHNLLLSATASSDNCSHYSVIRTARLFIWIYFHLFITSSYSYTNIYAL